MPRSEDWTLEDLLRSNAPDATKEAVKQLWDYFREPTVLVDMYDEKDNSPNKPAVAGARNALWVVTGKIPRVVHYSELYGLDLGSTPAIAFSGKPRLFVQYQGDGDFGARFMPVMGTIAATQVPVLGLCAGQQLAAMAYCGTNAIKRIDGKESGEVKMRINGWRDPHPDIGGILAPAHPLFEQYLKTGRLVHHNHAEYVDIPRNGLLKVIAESASTNGIVMPYIFEFHDAKLPSKRIIAFQHHPERSPFRDVDEGKPGIFSGLTLLVRAIDLLTRSGPAYDASRMQMYSPS